MDLQHQSTNALKVKVMILQKIIEEAEKDNDDRVWRPREQLAIIQKELERREQEAKELIIENEKKEDPENLVVGLKTIELKLSNK